MKIIIKATNFSLTENIKNWIERKVRPLEKFLPQRKKFEAKIMIEVAKLTKHHHKGEIFYAESQIALPYRKNIRGEAKRKDLYSAINELKDKLQIEFKKYKEKEYILKKKLHTKQL